MSSPVPLQPSVYYHIYNRGNNRENLFKEERNYSYFLRLWKKYIVLIADTYAYCLLPNHFHALVRIKDVEEFAGNRIRSGLESLPGRQFSNFFNAYARTINTTYKRTGALFQRPFGRTPISDNEYLFHLVTYIHQNPQKHGLVDDFRLWTYSSYQLIYENRQSFINREEVLNWYGNIDIFKQSHLQIITPQNIINLEDEDA